MNSNACPVTTDLNSYLADMDADEAFAEEVDEKIEELLKDPDTVAEAIDDMLAFGKLESLGPDIAAVITCNPADFEMRAARFMYEMVEKLRIRLFDTAVAEVEADRERDRFDGPEGDY